MITYQNTGALHPAVRSKLKRGLDLVLSGTGLLLTSPLMGAIALSIYWSMHTPILFRQKRPGLGGKPFLLYKFRTMRPIKPGEDMVASDGQRLTKLGAFLRTTSLDELPTLFNVFKGEMSLVGPRPLLMAYLQRYSKEEARRHHVKPGVTGWAQIHGRNAQTWKERFELDLWYVDHWSLALDLKILWKTLYVVLRREGIHAQGQATMPEFMGHPS